MGSLGNNSGEIVKGRGNFGKGRLKCEKMEKNLLVKCGESCHSDIAFGSTHGSIILMAS